MIAHVYDLLPGDQVSLPPHGTATHIAHVGHPYWTGLQLVIWRLADGTISLDALDIRQEVGELVHAPWDQRRQALARALGPALGGDPDGGLDYEEMREGLPPP